jgi:hypothetical protein
MTLSVDFDHQSRLVAVEVDDERADRLLAAELQAGEAAASDLGPEERFGDGGVSTKGTGAKLLRRGDDGGFDVVVHR